MKITLNGREHELSRRDVEGAVSKETPGTIQRYAVVIHGRRYPLKQVVASALRVPPVAFHSQQAYRWLVNLGFEVLDLPEQGRPRRVR